MTDSSVKGEPLRAADRTLCNRTQPAAEVGVYSGVKPPPGKPVRLPTLRRKKSRGEPIVAVTCYDATFARLVDDAGVDVVLIGDSLGNVIQ
ncbi:MAG: hypothetical protein CMH53_04595, partial [Myxococcales bacterium]|nr:hypothetical protein [Myxococcales bacterium]